MLSSRRGCLRIVSSFLSTAAIFIRYCNALLVCKFVLQTHGTIFANSAQPCHWSFASKFIAMAAFSTRMTPGSLNAAALSLTYACLTHTCRASDHGPIFQRPAGRRRYLFSRIASVCASALAYCPTKLAQWHKFNLGRTALSYVLIWCPIALAQWHSGTDSISA